MEIEIEPYTKYLQPCTWHCNTEGLVIFSFSALLSESSCHPACSQARKTKSKHSLTNNCCVRIKIHSRKKTLFIELDSLFCVRYNHYLRTGIFCLKDAALEETSMRYHFLQLHHCHWCFLHGVFSQKDLNNPVEKLGLKTKLNSPFKKPSSTISVLLKTILSNSNLIRSQELCCACFN